MKKAVLDYYAGAYGPTIRFDAVSPDALRRLGGALRSLANGEAAQVSIHSLEGVEVTNLAELVAEVTPSEPRVTLRRLGNTNGRPVFRWANTRDGWRDLAALVDKLLELNRPGHQYLTTEHADDALIEVCFMERREHTL